ncbi:hypothetical protein ES703_43969 [subsurface metagenome]
MANLFIGFPVPRAKIADMIIGSAPPLEHSVNHLPNGSDPIVLPGDIDPGEFLQWSDSKFIGAAAGGNGGFPSPISISCTQFNPKDDTIDYYCSYYGLRRLSDEGPGTFYAPVNFPHGVTVTKLTLFGHLNNVQSQCDIKLNVVDNTGSFNSMAEVVGDWSDGNGSGYDDSINYGTIDNVNYSYCIYAIIDPYDGVNNAQLKRVLIDFS